MNNNLITSSYKLNSRIETEVFKNYFLKNFFLRPPELEQGLISKTRKKNPKFPNWGLWVRIVPKVLHWGTLSLLLWKNPLLRSSILLFCFPCDPMRHFLSSRGEWAGLALSICFALRMCSLASFPAVVAPSPPLSWSGFGVFRGRRSKGGLAW